MYREYTYMYLFYTNLICSIILKRGLVELASFYRAIRGCSYHQHAHNHLTHRFRHYMNPIYTPFAYNGHARVLLFTIPRHTKPSVGSKTHSIAPHRPKIRLPTRASPTYKNVGCNNIPRCSRRECSTNLKHPPEHTGGGLCKQRPAFYLDLMPPKFLFALP